MNDELIALEAKLSELTRERNMRVSAARGAIDRANKEWDRVALPISRRINQLREQQPQVPTTHMTAGAKRERPRREPKQLADYDPDWTQEDIDHYLKLMAGK